MHCCRHLRLSNCALVAWAVLAAASLAPHARGQNRVPAIDIRIPAIPGFPVPGEVEAPRGARPGAAPKFNPADFDPQKMFEHLFGPAAKIDDEALAKVEISPEEESRLAQQTLDELKRQLSLRKARLVETGKDAEYLARLVELVRPQMTQARRYRRLHVYLAELDEPQAYSLPGGHLVFTRGLVDAAQCEAALVAVAGHELAHLDRGHLLRRARQWKLAQQSLASRDKAASPDKMFQTMGLMTQLFQRPFGPAEELEADRDGITWAYRLGYDPRAVQWIYDALEARAGGVPNFLPSFLRTHPPSAERTENLRKTLLDLAAAEPKPALYIGRENLARRLTRKQREFPE